MNHRKYSRHNFCIFYKTSILKKAICFGCSKLKRDGEELGKHWHSDFYKQSGSHQFSQRSDGVIFEQGQRNHTFRMWKALYVKPVGTVRNSHLSWKDFSICHYLYEACTKQTFINNSVDAWEFILAVLNLQLRWVKSKKYFYCSCKTEQKTEVRKAFALSF